MLAIGLALAPLVIALVRWLVPERRVVFVRWGFSHVGLAVLLALVAGGFTLLFPVHGKLDLLTELFRTAFVQGAVCCYIVFTAERLDPEGGGSLGWRMQGVARSLLAGFAAYVILFPTQLGSLYVWPWVLEVMGQDIAPQGLVEGFLDADGAVLPIAVLFTVVIVPLFEETLFRGFLQPLLVQNLNDGAGVVLTSLLFAMLHGTSAFLPIFCLSLLLGGLMLRTQRLGVVWAVHGGHNALVVTIALLTSGQGA